MSIPIFIDDVEYLGMICIYMVFEREGMPSDDPHEVIL